MALNDKQRRFVAEYLIDLNATQAAIRAGYSAHTARQIGEENLSKPDIAAAVAVEMQKRGERTGATADRVLQEAARLALFDPRKLFNADGSPIPIHELDDDTAAAIAGVKVIQLGGEEGPAIVKEYKIADKNSALEKLFKHHGLYERDNTQKVSPLVALIERIQGAALPVARDVDG